MKNKIIKFVIFLALWGFLYWLTTWSYGAIAFLLALLFTHPSNSEALLFLAKQFDANHNNLADVVSRLESEIELLSSDYRDLQSRYDDLQDEISEIKSKFEPIELDDFYDLIEDVESDKKL